MLRSEDPLWGLAPVAIGVGVFGLGSREGGEPAAGCPFRAVRGVAVRERVTKRVRQRVGP